MTKRYVKWNCAEEGNVEANARALSFSDSLCVAARDYDDFADENERLRTIAKYVYEDMQKEAWEEAAAYFRGQPSPGALDA